MDGSDWESPSAPALVACLSGQAIKTRGRRGERVVDSSYLLALNAGDDDLALTLPPAPYAGACEVVLDTAAETLPCLPAVPPVLAAQSVLLLRVLGD